MVNAIDKIINNRPPYLGFLQADSEIIINTKLGIKCKIKPSVRIGVSKANRVINIIYKMERIRGRLKCGIF